MNHLRGKSTFMFLLNSFSLEWKEGHDYYILSTEHVNTDIDASCILMRNIPHTCATVYMQSRGSKNKTWSYIVQIEPKFKEKVN